jgi:polysaccharide export outer membrane protein
MIRFGIRGARIDTLVSGMPTGVLAVVLMIVGFAAPVRGQAVRSGLNSAGADYRLGPGDRFLTTVWDGNELQEEELIVGADGAVLVPFQVNQLVDVNGRTALEVRDLILEQLRQVFRAPVVQVVATVFESQKAFLVGEVLNPGQWPITDGMTLLEFVLQNSQFQDDADITAVRLTRSDGSVEVIDLFEIVVGDRAPEVRLLPDDIVFIPPANAFSNKYFVLGEVVEPGVLESPNPLTLLEAITLRGSLTVDARTEKVILVRVDESGQASGREIRYRDIYEKGDLSLNVPLQNGDIIYVPRDRSAAITDVLGTIAPITAVVRDALFLGLLRR